MNPNEDENKKLDPNEDVTIAESSEAAQNVIEDDATNLSLDTSETSNEESSELEAEANPSETPPDGAPKKSSKKLLVILVLLLIITAGSAVAFLLLGKEAEAPSTKQTTSEELVKRLGVAVTLVDGTAEFSKDMTTWTALTADTDLAEGDYVRALEGSRVVLTLDDGSAVRVASQSTLLLESLVTDNVVIVSEGGELYSRVVASETRSFVVSVDGSSYKAMGTAFRTHNSDTKKGVEVFHSAVNIDADQTITEGSAFYKENSDPAKKGTVTALDVTALKSDEFIKWNVEQDKKDTAFADKLGVLVDIDKPAEPAPTPAPTPSPSKPVGISLSGSQDGNNAKFSWSINGVDTSKGFKLVRSKSSSKPTYPDNSVAFISAGKTSYSLFVGDGETYYYRLCAYRENGCDSYSNAVQVATTKKEKPVVEAGAVNLSISGTTASWTFAGTAPNGFKLVMSTTTGPIYPDHSKKYVSDTTTSMPSDIDSGVTYYVRVCKYTGDGCQDYSNEVTYTKP